MLLMSEWKPTEKKKKQKGKKKGGGNWIQEQRGEVLGSEEKAEWK